MVEHLLRKTISQVSGLTRPIRGLHEAAYLLASLTLASQILALIRDRIFAHQFGASAVLDVYYAAFRVPDVVFALVASTVSAYVLIPRIASLDTIEARRLLSQAASFLLVMSTIFCLILFVFAPTLLFRLFPGFVTSAYAGDFVFLSRILLLQPILLGLSGVLGSVTQVKRHFFLFALSPLLYNLGIIGGTLFLYPTLGLKGIGIGVIVGAMVHLTVNIPIVASSGLLPRLTIPSPKIIWSIVRDSVPRSLALSMGAIVTLIVTAEVSRAGEGGVSVFALAGNLAGVPLSLIGASYATAAFPVLAEHIGANRQSEFVSLLRTAARHLIFWSTTVSLLAIVLRAHLVRVLLGSGAFDWDATRLTAAIFAVLIIALTSQGLMLLVSRAFYAAGRSWYPFFIQGIGALLSVLGGYALLHAGVAYPILRYFIESLLRITDVPGSSAVLVALGATIGQLIMGILALISLRIIAPALGTSLIRPILEGAGAGVVGGGVAYMVLFLMGNIAPLTTLLAVFAQGTIAGTVGFVAACGVLYLLENNEFRMLFASLHRLSLRMLPAAQSEL